MFCTKHTIAIILIYPLIQLDREDTPMSGVLDTIIPAIKLQNETLKKSLISKSLPQPHSFFLRSTSKYDHDQNMWGDPKKKYDKGYTLVAILGVISLSIVTQVLDYCCGWGIIRDKYSEEIGDEIGVLV